MNNLYLISHEPEAAGYSVLKTGNKTAGNDVLVVLENMSFLTSYI